MTRGAIPIRAVLAAALALCSCAGGGSLSPPSIVLVVLDTVRADAVSAYGRVDGTTPELDRLAAAGVLYERAYAQAPWTLPSHATIFSGLPPSGHGVSSRRPVAPEAVVMLAERLREAGYDTAGISENPWIQPGTRLSAGFDHFRRITFRTEEEVRARPALAAVRAWLEGRETERPFFLFVNFIDAHAPYRVREENPFLPVGVDRSTAEALVEGLEPAVCSTWSVDSREMAILRGLYLGGLAAADEKLSALIGLLDERADDRRRITIVTSDHGEHFGEHGLRDHYYSLHEDLLRVPLVVHGLAGPARISEPVALMDLVPSILGWVELPVPEDLPGRPLPLEPKAASLPARTLTASFADPLADRGPPGGRLGRLIRDHARDLRRSCPPGTPVPGDQRSAIRHPHKLLRQGDSAEALFDLDRDPRESRDLARAEPQLRSALAAALAADPREHAQGDEGAPPLSEDSLDALRALGYVREERDVDRPPDAAAQGDE